MFLQNEAGEGKSLYGSFENFRKSLKGLADEMLAFDTQAKKVVGDTFGQGSEFADKIRQSIGAAVVQTAALGYTTEQYATLLTQISSSLQTNVLYTTEQLTNMMAFADAAGITAEETGKIVAGFQNIGIGAEEALKDMEGMAKTARTYGVNVSQYMGVISENLKLMNQFKFQNGVDGLANMVAKSQALRININTVTTLAEKFLDPEGAIDAAASLQMMGGQLAQLGDGFQLMNLAQNDIDGLFDSIVEATAASASFNEETGNYEFSVLEMRRLRATAKALGVDMEELTKGAINFAERQDKISQLDFLGYSDEDKEFLASIGQLDKGGELKFAIDRGTDDEGNPIIEFKNAADLQKNEIEKLRVDFNEQSKENAKSSLDVAREQRNLLQEIYDQGLIIRKITTGQAVSAEDGTFGKFSEAVRGLGDTFSAMTNNIMDNDLFEKGTTLLVEGMEDAARAMTGGATIFDDAVEKFKNWASGASELKFEGEAEAADDLVSLPGYRNRVLSGPEGSISLNDNDTVIAGTDLFPKDTENTSQMDKNTMQIMGNLPKEFANVLQNNIGPSEPPKITFEDLQITHSGSIRLEGDGRFLTLDMLANNPQMLENLTNMIKLRMSSQTMGYNNA